jgi:hypothetical protein
MINTKISELRQFAKDNDIFIDGDKRRKQSFIDSITAWMEEAGCFDAMAQSGPRKAK